jgi:porphobilinogen synthase
MSFPTRRMRRLRRTPILRRMVRETTLAPSDLIAGVFVVPGQGVRQEIKSMPGVFRVSPDVLVEDAALLAERGVPALILFGIPDKKSEDGAAAWDPRGPCPRPCASSRPPAPT